MDHRLSRNFYKGIFGDNINMMPAAAAFNFKRMMNKWKSSLFALFFNRFKLAIFTLNKLVEMEMRSQTKQSNGLQSKLAF
jgi:IS5 family transposase